MDKELEKVLIEFESKRDERSIPFATDTEEKKAYFNNLLTLQDEGDIEGITDRGKEHINRNHSFYIISGARLTSKGRNFLTSIKDK